jgi:hypothetical protein
MPDRHGTVREVVWSDICPWLILVSAARVAFSPRVLLLATAALLGVAAGTHGIGWTLGQGDHLQMEVTRTDYEVWPWELLRSATGNGTDSRSASLTAPLPTDRCEVARLPVDLAAILGRRMADPVLQLVASDRAERGALDVVYLALCLIWTVAIWAFFGGAIARTAALALAREERLAALPALRFSAAKWRDLFGAPLLPLVGALLIMVPLALLGIGIRFEPLVLVAGLLWPLVLLAGFLLAIILVGLAFGWPLLWPAISAERGDSFDAVSSCYAYIYQRPLHYVFYLVVAALVGIGGALVVHLFAAGVLGLSNWAVAWGCGADRLAAFLVAAPNLDASWPLERGAALMRFWVAGIDVVQLAFYYGFFWTAATAIYLLLRRAVDAKEMDEVVLDDEAETSGLAPLVGVETGVPEIAESALRRDSEASNESQ